MTGDLMQSWLDDVHDHLGTGADLSNPEAVELLAEVDQLRTDRERLYARNVGATIAALDAAGYGKPGTPNTLRDMVQEALAEVDRLRDFRDAAVPVLRYVLDCTGSGGARAALALLEAP